MHAFKIEGKKTSLKSINLINDQFFKLQFLQVSIYTTSPIILQLRKVVYQKGVSNFYFHIYI